MGKKRKITVSPAPVASEAEEFMALLLAAQSTDHNCAWCNYFRDMGKRLISQYVPEGEGDE